MFFDAEQGSVTFSLPQNLLEEPEGNVSISWMIASELPPLYVNEHPSSYDGHTVCEVLIALELGDALSLDIFKTLQRNLLLLHVITKLNHINV